MKTCEGVRDLLGSKVPATTNLATAMKRNCHAMLAGFDHSSIELTTWKRVVFSVGGVACLVGLVVCRRGGTVGLGLMRWWWWW